MDVFALPIVNGILPRPEGGVLEGLFLDPLFMKMLASVGIGGDIFLFPFSTEDDQFYPVGVLVRIEDMWTDKINLKGKTIGLFARVIGRDRCKAKGFEFYDESLIATGVEKIDFQALRASGYPVICGAGWHPTGGYTTFGSDKRNIEITIYGYELETGNDVAIIGYLNNIIEPEKAHTVEHAIIRSLNNYALCTPKTLRKCMKREAEELKWSVELGIAKKLPEVFGVTRSGICGNPMTQMASYYLSEEFKNQLKEGTNIVDSLETARNKTVSKLIQDMEISTQKGLRELQGLKKGMFHDDTPEELKTLKTIISKFPQSPWN